MANGKSRISNLLAALGDDGAQDADKLVAFLQKGVDFIIIDYGLLNKSQPISCFSCFFAGNAHLMNEVPLAFCTMSFFDVCPDRRRCPQELAADHFPIHGSRKSLHHLHRTHRKQERPLANVKWRPFLIHFCLIHRCGHLHSSVASRLPFAI